MSLAGPPPQKNKDRMASISSGIYCWALFWTGPVWWEGLVYGNRREREREIVREEGKESDELLACTLFPPVFSCVLPFPCRSPSPPSLSPFLFTIPPISSAGSIERSIGQLPELSPRPSRLRLDCSQPEPGRIGIQLIDIPKSIHPWGGCCW